MFYLTNLVFLFLEFLLNVLQQKVAKKEQREMIVYCLCVFSWRVQIDLTVLMEFSVNV